MALLLTSFYIAAKKEHLMKRQTVFICVDSAFPQLYYRKFHSDRLIVLRVI